MEKKAAHLHREGLGNLKMALTGSNTASLIGILEGAFVCMESDTASTISTDDIPAASQTETQEKLSESIPMTSSGDSSSATIELVFLLKSPFPVVPGIPESLLPLCGPETSSCYRCQYPSCNEEFSQKPGTCNHVCHDHLHVALACLYCSASNSPKMQWYSASAWEHHTHKHVLDNLPIHPNAPAFSEQFDEIGTLPSVPKLTSTLPPSINIYERAKDAKQFLAEENKESTFPSQGAQTPMSSPTPKHCPKQGPIKSSKKVKATQYKNGGK